jgi:hypothetical protein
MTDDYEVLRDVEVELDGARHEGKFRLGGHSVIVYVKSEIKFGDYGMNRPETVARWMLSDLVRRVNSGKRRPFLR